MASTEREMRDGAHSQAEQSACPLLGFPAKSGFCHVISWQLRWTILNGGVVRVPVCNEDLRYILTTLDKFYCIS